MKIALLDIIHTTNGAHSNNTPLAIGLISAYLKKNIAEELDIKLFKESEKAMEVFASWVPDVVGISLYTWNSQLNLYFARYLKQLNPNCLVIAGGPNIDLEPEKRKKFLLDNRAIDICIAYDGEIPFLDIIKRVLSRESSHDITANPSAGTFCLNPENLEYLESKEPIPRLTSLDEFGAVYKDGVFDEFLDDGYYPMMQTHRGCPFGCAYCRTSDSYYTRMLFQSPAIFKEDIEYLAKRFSGKDEVYIILANTNMSLFKEDFEVARIIREMQKNYKWPKYVYFDTGKDPKKLLEMLSIIKFVPAPALQTLTPDVLKNINRINLPFDDYVAFQREVLKITGENSMSELILCLPGESKETFLQTLKKVINSGVQSIVIYTLIDLPATPLSSPEYFNKYKYTLRHRVVPRQYSLINGEKILDTEEVIVATKDLSFADYLELRGFCFTVTNFFNAVEFIPIKKLLLENNLDLFQWLVNIHSQIKDFPDLEKKYQSFIEETKEELFLTQEELINYFQKEENFNDLLAGKKGDNLLRKYKHLVFSDNYLDCLKLLIQEARKIFLSTYPDFKDIEMLDDLYSFLATRDVNKIITDKDNVTIEKNKELKYDIPSWLAGSQKDCLLLDYKKICSYRIKFDDNQKRILKNLNTHKDITLSLQMLFRDGRTKDLWPTWEKVN